MFNKLNPNSNIIFVDIDDTICDTRKAFVDIYKRVTGEEPAKMNVRNYEDMCPLWTQKNEITRLFKYGKDIYNEAQPIQGAKEGIDRLLKKGYVVKLVTLNFADSAFEKQKWVERHFPELADHVIMLTSINTNKDIFKGHAIIDDDFKNIRTNCSNYPILLDTYNIYDEMDYIHKYRGWKDLVDKF